MRSHMLLVPLATNYVIYHIHFKTDIFFIQLNVQIAVVLGDMYNAIQHDFHPIIYMYKLPFEVTFVVEAT